MLEAYTSETITRVYANRPFAYMTLASLAALGLVLLRMVRRQPAEVPRVFVVRRQLRGTIGDPVVQRERGLPAFFRRLRGVKNPARPQIAAS